MAKHKPAHSVEWFVHNRKKPVAYSTKSASLTIRCLAEDGKTFKQIRDMFTNKQAVFNPEVVAVLDALIKYGDGSLIARDNLDPCS